MSHFLCRVCSLWIENSSAAVLVLSIVCFFHRLLELGLEGEVIRSQDLSHVIMMVARNPRGHYLAWNFVKKNWDTLVQKLVLHKNNFLNDFCWFADIKPCDGVRVQKLSHKACDVPHRFHNHDATTLCVERRRLFSVSTAPFDTGRTGFHSRAERVQFVLGVSNSAAMRVKTSTVFYKDLRMWLSSL